MTRTNQQLRTTGAWYLCVIKSGIDAIDAFRTGRHAYCCPQSDGRVFIIAKDGKTAVLSLDCAARCLSRVKRADGSLIRVAGQERTWHRWHEARDTRHAA